MTWRRPPQQQGVSYEDFKANIRNSIITQQVVRDEVGRKISMSPGEVQAYFKAHESEFAQPESVTLNEILIPTPAKSATEGADTAEVAAAQAQADEIEKKLAAGAKFDDLAKPSPTDPNAPKSVVLGEYRRGMLVKEIEDKAFALNAGEHTQPIRTKQGFIILQATQHNAGGEASFKQVEPQVEEALFLERMQPKLREYLTKLREEAAIDIKPGVVDTGASGNEMKLSYSAYTPPAPKKQKKFAARPLPRQRSLQVRTGPDSKDGCSRAPRAAAAAPAATTDAARDARRQRPPPRRPPPSPRPRNRQAITTRALRSQASARRFALARLLVSLSLPRKSRLQSAPDAGGPAVTTPETRYVNPDGTVSGEQAAAPERKTRLSNRPVVHKPKTPKTPDTSNQPTPEELAAQKVQNAPMGADRPQRGQETQAEGREDPLLRQAEGSRTTPSPISASLSPHLRLPLPPASRQSRAPRPPGLRNPVRRNEGHLRCGCRQIRKPGSRLPFSPSGPSNCAAGRMAASIWPSPSATAPARSNRGCGKISPRPLPGLRPETWSRFVPRSAASTTACS